MNSSFLTTIVEKTRTRVAAARADKPLDIVRREAVNALADREKHRLRKALERDGLNIIAEFKRASPSKGVINADRDLAATVRAYESARAAAVSVLTEPEYFRGSLDDLRAARAAVDLPLLRKDFVVDAYQIYEAAAAGADAVLLIVAALSDGELSSLLQAAEGELGIDALVEVHTASELDRAAAAGAKLIGVNNRDLKTLAVSLDVSRNLIRHKPGGALMIAESGISTAGDIAELRSLGFDGFLVGETLMRSGDPAEVINEWRSVSVGSAGG
ncbi:MAG: indole-3-glycerol phosphate synthase TrpC [Pyrinomonadaceae bacterium]